MTDNDSPWKELLEENLRETLGFFFPEIHSEIDWERDYEVLRQELLPVAPSGAKRIADVVVKAFSGGGDERYLHGEVQGQKEAGFERRIHIYNSPIDDKTGLPVISFVLLIDEDPAWRPDRYEATLCGKTRHLEFHSRKIIDWLGKEEELESASEPRRPVRPGAIGVDADEEGRRGAGRREIRDDRADPRTIRRRDRTAALDAVSGLAVGVAPRV